MEYAFPERQFVRESRPFDYVYDNVYTTSSRKDFCEAASIGSRTAAQIRLRPIYKSMFSELQSDRRLEGCLVDKVPGLYQNFLPPCNDEGMAPDNLVCVRAVEPTGADRAKFAIQYGGTNLETQYKMAYPTAPFDMDEEILNARRCTTQSARPVRMSRGQQTDYRESEAQTDPFSPPYQLPHGDAYPRLLALLNLTWGKGLPPTLEDIVNIERALTRRLADMANTSVDDETNRLKYSKMMEELEAQLWADREKELFKLMEQKKVIMKKLRHELRLKVASRDSKKLEQIFDVEKSKHAVVLAGIRHKYLRDLRKLERKHCKQGPASRVEALMADSYYGDAGRIQSKMPSSLQKRHAPDYEFPLTNDYQLFEQLTTTESFKRNHLEFNCQEFNRCILSTRQTNREHRTERMLDEAFSAFRTEALKDPKPTSAKLINRIMKGQIRRVPTPTVEGPSVEDELESNAIVLLQKIIRGRAVQTMMRDEIRSNASMLADMKALHEMDPSGNKATFGEIASMEIMQKERDAQAEKELELREITDQLAGETLGHQLEFLEKEMVRLQDERKIHSLLMLAERERRMKEAIEAGKRQQEEDERRVNDEIFRQVVGIHQGTVDIYLEDMYLSTLERTADANARTYIQKLASTLNEAAYMAQQSAVADDEGEEMTAEIVHSFLMPEMNRIYHRQKMEALNNLYMQASCQVASSVCTAQGVVRDIVDSLYTTIPAHLDAGEAVVDATQIAVDQIIKDAVTKAFPSEAPAPETCELKGEDEVCLPPQPTELEQLPTTSARKIRKSQKIPVEVPCLDVELGLKSIELETGTEIGIDAVNLMLAAKHVTHTVFDEVKQVVESCFEENEGEDLELESDDDEVDI